MSLVLCACPDSPPHPSLGVRLANPCVSYSAGATAFVKSQKILNVGGENFSCMSWTNALDHQNTINILTFKLDEGCDLVIWAAAEISTTIMASCIPVLRVFIREVRHGTHGSRHLYSWKRNAGGPSAGGGGGSGAPDPHDLISLDRDMIPLSRLEAHSTASATGDKLERGPEDSGSDKIITSASYDFSARGLNPDEAIGPVMPTGACRIPGKIMRTQEIAVEFGERGSEPGLDRPFDGSIASSSARK